MKRVHLTEIEAVDLAWGEPLPASKLAHAAECLRCAERVAATRQGRVLVEQEAVPERDEVFWQAQLARTMARVDEHVEARRRRAWIAWPLAFASTAALAAAVVIVHSRVEPLRPTPAPLAAWAPLPPAEEDSGYGLVSELVPAAEEAAADEPVAMSSSWEGFYDLTPDEQRSMLEALETELGRDS